MRHRTGRGYKPHLSLVFNAGKRLTFAVDTTNSRAVQPDAYLITHAHSDHFGKSAMLSENAVCSEETAKALEILHGIKYAGRTFRLGDTIDVSGVKVRTYPTHHTIGSAAFFWENDAGARIMVTGDVKDAGDLPKCDCLVTEANYGDPADPKCHFTDDIDAFHEALDYGNVAFGAYAFGKAQRAVRLLRDHGYSGEIGMDPTSRALTQGLMENTGPLAGLDNDCAVKVMSLSHLAELSAEKKFILTGRHDHRIPAINISDHMDVNGLVDMVNQCAPSAVIAYHPGGHRPYKLAAHLNSLGTYARALEEINTVIEM